MSEKEEDSGIQAAGGGEFNSLHSLFLTLVSSYKPTIFLPSA